MERTHFYLLLIHGAPTRSAEMDSVTFYHDSVLSDVHMLQPRARHLMTRLNRAGQPVFLSKFRFLPQDETEDTSSRKTEVTEPEKPQSTGDSVSGQSSEKPQETGDSRDLEGSSEESSEEDQSVFLDQDGDFDFTNRKLRRKPSDCERDEVCPVLLSQVTPTDSWYSEDPEEDSSAESTTLIKIEHTMATLLEDVGKQVWRGALLMADWVLSEPRTFTGATVLELGAGTGLSSIITASVAKRVYCTDVGEDLLSMCKKNVSLNKHLMEHNGGEVRVRQLDWLQSDLCTDSEQEFSWSEEEVADLYDNTTVIIAADVVYDDDFTDALFKTLYHLCCTFNHSCDIYISIEKRLNFSLRHMDVCCEAYEHFRHCLQQLQELSGSPAFEVQRVAPSFRQCIMYERVEQLELWKVSVSYPSRPQETFANP